MEKSDRLVDCWLKVKLYNSLYSGSLPDILKKSEEKSDEKVLCAVYLPSFNIFALCV